MCLVFPIRRTRAERALLVLFLAVATTVSHFHEYWRDELQAWMIVRDSASVAELLHNSRYEGHPSLWFCLLFCLKQVAPGLAAMKALHLAIAASSTWLILRYSPFSLRHRALLVFGYFFLYEYAVIARNYAVGVFCVLAACALFPRRASPGAFLLIALAVAGMMLSNIYSFFLGLAFAFLLIADGWRRPGRFAWRRWPGYAVMVAAALLFLADTRPPADYGYWPTWRTGLGLRPLAELFARAGYVFFPIPSAGTHFWNTVFYPTDGLQAAVGLGVVAAAVWLIPRKSLSRLFMGCVVAAVLLFSYVKFPGHFRHNGHLFIAFVAMCWIEPSLPGPERPRKRVAPVLFTVILIAQAVAGVMASIMEVTRPFSQAQSAAEWINQNRPGSLVVAHDDAGTSSAAAFLDTPPFYPRSGTYGTWIVWNTRRLESNITEQSLVVTGDSLAVTTGKEVLWLTTEPIGGAEKYGLVLVKRFEPSVEPLESYWLYGR
jgi:hypothetical protein